MNGRFSPKATKEGKLGNLRRIYGRTTRTHFGPATFLCLLPLLCSHPVSTVMPHSDLYVERSKERVKSTEKMASVSDNKKIYKVKLQFNKSQNVFVELWFYFELFFIEKHE